jgi:hypothetical protein
MSPGGFFSAATPATTAALRKMEHTSLDDNGFMEGVLRFADLLAAGQPATSAVLP